MSYKCHIDGKSGKQRKINRMPPIVTYNEPNQSWKSRVLAILYQTILCNLPDAAKAFCKMQF